MKSTLLALLMPLVLAIAVTASGLWIVAAKHHSRQLFSELEELNRERDRLQVDWGRLQLEKGTMAERSRIETLARDKLELSMPSDVVVIEGPRP